MMAIGALLLNHKLNNKPMGTSFIPLSAIIAVLIIAFLFASLPHVNHKTRYRVLHNDLYNLSISLSSTYKCNFLGADNKQ